MLKKILPIFMLCAIALSMASCLEDEKETLVYYDDTAVTGFSIGNLNKYITVKSSSGSDSIVKSVIDASSYRFTINNATHEIYNVDSLPVGVDVKKVLCTVSTKNSGLAVWYMKSSEGKDSMTYCSSTDSVDFTNTRELRVYNTSMTAFRKYTVKLNVHQEVADSFVWKNLATTSAFANLQAMKMVSIGNAIYIFGYDGTKTILYAANRNGFANFVESNIVLDADVYKNVAVYNGLLYFLNGTSLESLDANGTLATVATTTIKRLLGAGNNRLYAYSADGAIVYSVDGKAWMPCAMDGDVASLPESNMNLLTMPSKTNSDTYLLSLVGNDASSKYANVWGKIEEDITATNDQPWTQYVMNDNRFRLPALANLQTFVYQRKIMAIGGKGINGNAVKAFSKIYSSQDAGLTWQTDTTLVMPTTFAPESDVFAMTIDADNFIWLVSASNGQIWRGRLNKLGWANKE